MEFTPITTQEAFDEAIKARIDRNTKTVTAEVTKKYEGFISPEDYTAKTADFSKQIETLTAQVKDNDKTIADLTAKNKAYETASVKTRIASEFGIPAELAGRLNGETEEDIRKDAEIMSKFTGNGHMPPFSPNRPETNSKDEAFRKMLQKMNGGN